MTMTKHRKELLFTRKISCAENWKISHLREAEVFFDVLHLNSDFLHKDPDQWETEDSFVQSRTIVSKLKVVNDCAERGVALATEYNSLITYDEEQKQYLLQAVTDHRKRFLDCKKSTLNK